MFINNGKSRINVFDKYNHNSSGDPHPQYVHKSLFSGATKVATVLAGAPTFVKIMRITTGINGDYVFFSKQIIIKGQTGKHLSIINLLGNAVLYSNRYLVRFQKDNLTDTLYYANVSENGENYIDIYLCAYPFAENANVYIKDNFINYVNLNSKNSKGSLIEYVKDELYTLKELEEASVKLYLCTKKYSVFGKYLCNEEPNNGYFKIASIKCDIFDMQYHVRIATTAFGTIEMILGKRDGILIENKGRSANSLPWNKYVSVVYNESDKIFDIYCYLAHYCSYLIEIDNTDLISESKEWTSYGWTDMFVVPNLVFRGYTNNKNIPCGFYYRRLEELPQSNITLKPLVSG